MSGTQPIVLTPKLRDRSTAALDDARLRTNLVRATDAFAERKAAAYAQFEDVDGLRETARAVKARVLSRLPQVLERLADNVLARGGHVCWARTAEEASAYIADVAARHQARKIVKSKSMAGEEIGLNEVLEGRGLEVVETDLGEWIIQIANETPSHIIVPAIHKDRSQIARTLEKVAGGDLSDVPEELAAFARERLRQHFLAADMAVTGVNFGVAETGSLVLVTNEGNGRMCTSLPPVHVALMGMERVVETWAELDVMMALLPRAATGQPVTTYVNTVTGPRGPGEADGPDELHLVILDNGRAEVLGTEFHEMLACIRCGACLNACPVYRQMGGHAYGWVYSGPMGAVLTPLLAHDPHAGEVAQASSLCGACWDACPVAIPLQDLLLALRRRSAEDNTPRAQRLAWQAWAATWSRPGRYRASLKAASWGGRVPGLEHAPGPLKRWTAVRSLPSPAPRTFRELWHRGEL